MMGIFGGPIPHRKQPTYPTPVIKHGLGHKLEVAVNGAFRHPVDLARGCPITYDSGVTPSAHLPTSGSGLGKVLEPGLGKMLIETGKVQAGPAVEGSACIILNRTATPATSFSMWQFSNATYDYLYANSTEFTCYSFWQIDNWLTSVPFNQPADGQMIIIFTVKDGKQVAYLNGKVIGSNNLVAFGSSVPYFPYYINFTGEVYGKLQGLFVWSRFLSEREVQELSSNPWQMFEPAPKQIWTSLPDAVTGRAPLYLNRDKGAIATASLSDKVNNSIVPYDVSPGYGTAYITFGNDGEGYVDVSAGLQPINPAKVKVWVDPTDSAAALGQLTYTASYGPELFDWDNVFTIAALSVKKFDPTLGTLTGLRYTYTIDLIIETITTELDGINPGSATYDLSASFDDVSGSTGISETVGLTGIVSYVPPNSTVSKSETAQFTTTQVLNPAIDGPSYSGRDQMLNLAITAFTASGISNTGSVSYDLTSSGKFKFSITYDYIPATNPKTANDHRYLPLLAKFTVGENPNGDGFRIYGRSKEKLNGTFKLRYSYS